MIGNTISHYQILENFGKGSMDIVNKAENYKLDRPVALKFLPMDITALQEGISALSDSEQQRPAQVPTVNLGVSALPPEPHILESPGLSLRMRYMSFLIRLWKKSITRK